MKLNKIIFSVLLLVTCCPVWSQIGEHRNDISVGFHGGVNLSTISFTPEIQQNMHRGLHLGLQARYTCEKYFTTICSIQGEINFSQLGWKEKILTLDNEPVISKTTGVAQDYDRTITYIQVPILAHLAWGKEKHGLNFYLNAGPQFGFWLSEKTTKTFEISEALGSDYEPGRASSILAQDTMAVENKFDYGIAAGVGIEWSIRKVGRFQLEGRYYYGLGNIYGDSKRDYFASSNHQTITIRLGYLFDL